MAMFAESAELVASELVTNAVRASTDERGHPLYHDGRMAVIHVRLIADRDRGRLVLEVWDMSSSPPAIQHAAAEAEQGRGLELVAALAHRWDWRTGPGWPGKCVWAELRR
jgi:hypothetical protein